MNFSFFLEISWFLPEFFLSVDSEAGTDSKLVKFFSKKYCLLLHSSYVYYWYLVGKHFLTMSYSLVKKFYRKSCGETDKNVCFRCWFHKFKIAKNLDNKIHSGQYFFKQKERWLTIFLLTLWHCKKNSPPLFWKISMAILYTRALQSSKNSVQ